MCGICGVFNLDGRPVEPVLVDRMTAALQHRGPDGQGRFLDGEIGLGHRRLSIIDVAGGAQPLSNEDGRITVVFNGEIYNYIELRRELESFGHVFKTQCDTEVIVHAYEQWGEDCVRRFNGMFAFALWDGRHRELFMARDHLGIKPLYYARVGDRLLFASEIKALLQDAQCPREVDLDALIELFTFRCVPSPKTLFRHIFKLPPAHRMVVSARGQRMSRFWDWVPGHSRNGSESALVEEYQALLEDAVRLQMRSDVPLGLFLSSGVDSGALLAIMSRHSAGPVQTFTIGFEEGEHCNEIDDARELARRFGAEHHSLMVGPEDYVKYFDRYMRDIEEPVAHEAAPAFHFVSQIAGRHVKVALTGQGADEPWAGYDRYKGIKLSRFYSRLPRPLTEALARLAVHVPGRMERLKRGLMSLGEPELVTRFLKVYSFISTDMKARLFQGELKQRFEAEPHLARRALERWQVDVRERDPLTQMLYIDTRTSLPDDLLMVGDKTSMANSLELRVPFLDYRLVEFIESLPPRLKLKGLTGKYLHKCACRKWLPDTVIRRKKKGFDNPLEKWFRVRMRTFVEDCLLSRDSFLGRYFNRQCLREILDLDRSGREQLHRHIHLLVSVELWHRAFLRVQWIVSAAIPGLI
ncbi:MAG: asparagine synthase (glutamine-hydrolyzing) [Verrucomicrobiales bacterium]|nr:asparagine synthase (glutamine-hydrolyzing) [Verrucomicrobiales bacterium]